MPKNKYTSFAYAKFIAVAGLFAVILIIVSLPLLTGVSYLTGRVNDTIKGKTDTISGVLPQIAQITDSRGHRIAFLYKQQRTSVNFQDISPEMIKAIISIEDKRFMEHNGVDIKGTIRALFANYFSGKIVQGASTLDQQYIKNFEYLIQAENDQQRAAAIAETPERKINEARAALELEAKIVQRARKSGKTSKQAHIIAKKEVITRYLNLISFSNNIFGVEQASLFYFHKHALGLAAHQAAMLAGIVQKSGYFNPYVNPQAVLKRRNIVLDKMAANFPENRDKYLAAKNQPLGVVPHPTHLQQGCITNPDDGFFCQYVLSYLQKNLHISLSDIEKGSYIIRTTLDPDIQKRTLEQTRSTVSPTTPQIALVNNVLAPGQTSHAVLAMVSSRLFGADSAKSETELPETFTIEGDGAGSIFKIFTAASALEQGMGGGNTIPVPYEFKAKNMGYGGAKDCPPHYYCVMNDGKYLPFLSLQKALATSPNTAFVQLLQSVGVPQAVNMAVRLGLRSYKEPGSSGFTHGLADYVTKANLGSFTLGPFPVNPLELANVSATLASHGVWCPPNPIAEILKVKRDNFGAAVHDKQGRPVLEKIPTPSPKCEQAISPQLADTLAYLLSEDARNGGTSARSAARAGFYYPVSAKTGTTESYRSAGFLGFTNKYAGAAYLFSDGNHPQPICTSPVRTCYKGDIYGGEEPAYSWLSSLQPFVAQQSNNTVPKPDPELMKGSPKSIIPPVIGKTLGQAQKILHDHGFKTTISYTVSAYNAGIVDSTSPFGGTVPGGYITIHVANGVHPVKKVKSKDPVDPDNIDDWLK